MSADLYLCALPDRPDLDDLIARHDRIGIIGDLGPDGEASDEERAMRASGELVTLEEWEELRAVLFYSAANLWIGQVSWMKTSLHDDEPNRYLPLVVERVSGLTAEAPVLTPGLAKEITVAFNLPHISHYERTYFRRMERRYGYGFRHQPGYPGMFRDYAEHGGKRPVTQTIAYRGDGFVIVRERGRGVNSGAVAKRWLECHIGQRVMATSE
jgi:hypothetical protein